METIKTAGVVVVLLGILYGVYVALNKPEPPAPPETAWNQGSLTPPNVELGQPAGEESLQPVTPDSEAAPPRGAGRATLALDSTRPALTTDLAQARPAPLPKLQSPIAESERAPAQQASADLPVPRTAASEPAPEEAAPRVAKEDGRSPNSPPKPLRLSDLPEAVVVRPFDNAWRSAVAQIQKQDWAGALLTLSLFYNDVDVTGEDRQRLLDLLDPLAGKVFYSTEHTLEAPCEVRPGETLDEIAERYHVPTVLLQRINGIDNPSALQPGTQLKVVRGPFRAEIDLHKNSLVLFQGKCYAGLFSISVGNDPPPRAGEYEIIAKQEAREFRTADGARIPARSEDNPYGNAYLDLGNNLAIHGSPKEVPAHGSLGCISLNPTDAADIYGILTVGSTVTIR